MLSAKLDQFKFDLYQKLNQIELSYGMTFASAVRATTNSSIQTDSNFKDLLLLCEQEAHLLEYIDDEYMAESKQSLSRLKEWNEICWKVKVFSTNCKVRLQTIHDKILDSIYELESLNQ